MIYILDTGPLVAALRRPQDRDPFTPWAAKLIRSLPYPLFTCDAVLTEAAHFLIRFIAHFIGHFIENSVARGRIR